MVEAANSAVRSHPHWKAELARLEPRLGRSKAVVAIARKLLVAANKGREGQARRATKGGTELVALCLPHRRPSSAQGHDRTSVHAAAVGSS